MNPALPLLREQPIAPGDRWLYSAGFNVDAALRGTLRIDAELADLSHIASRGGRVAVLSHQGSYADGTARHLDFVVDYLRERLPWPVSYHPECASAGAVRRSHELRPSEIVLFGNTRHEPGEQLNDPDLARRFAELGDAVAIGGFSKAHRAHASNVGVLEHLPGYATRSLLAELDLLAPWAGAAPDRYSVAVLGGRKKEKVTIGLAHLTRHYDVVIPGGVVLNTLLAALGHDLGASHRGDAPARCTEVARTVLASPHRAKLHLPREVVIARRDGDRYVDARPVPVEHGVPPDREIVDFVLTPETRRTLTRLSEGGRALLAGTPARYTDGFEGTCTTILTAMNTPAADSLLLGGDTVAELPWHSTASTGGGSALHYVATGTTPVLDALRTAHT